MARDKKDDIELNPLTGEIDLVAANAPDAKAERELMEIKAGFSEDQRRVTHLMGQRAGRKQMTSAIQKLLMISDLVDLKSIKESKQYKGYDYIDENGNCQQISTFDDFCTHVEGRSRQSVDLDLANLNQLGEGFFDAMRKIGIGPATMRDYRKLPDDEKQALLEVAQNGDKDSFVELVSTLITKHQREKETTAKQLTKLADDLDAQRKESAELIKAKDDVIKGKSEFASQLEEKLAIALNKKADTSEAAQDTRIADARLELQEVANQVKIDIMTDLRVAVQKLIEDTPGQHIQLAAACLIEIGRELGQLRDDFNLPRIISDTAPLDATWAAITAEQEAE
jgi:hypothetical protein